MENWDVVATKGHVELIYGRVQLGLVEPCLRSVSERLSYAGIHYRDFRRLLEEYLKSKSDHEPYFLYWLSLDGGEDEFNLVIRRIGAQLIACIQSMHSIEDILAHAIYYALGINLTNEIPSRRISLPTVIERLNAVTDADELCQLLTALKSGNGHLSALANHAKHRSLILPALSEDWTGERDKRHSVQFQAFKYSDASYPEVDAMNFLESEYNRIVKLVVHSGVELNVLLERRNPK